jgi:hypothetical protein
MNLTITTTIPPKTMRDVATSLSSSSFRRFQLDGRVFFARRVKTLGTLMARRPTPKA